MTKHRYEVSGLDSQCEDFISECYDNDIIEAIKQYREIHCSVHQISRKEQVNANMEKKIIGIFRP